MSKSGKCKAGYYYCYTDKVCKPISKGMRVTARFSGSGKEPEEVGIDKPLNGNGNGNGGNGNGNGGGMSESKSGDSSLRDWFGKSKSSDGKPGWVQLGGKYAGKPCARQPGQTTKPKCGSSKMKRNLSKDEEERAFRRKNAKDPNPDRKGKAINVKTEETILEKEMRDKQGNDKFDRYKRMVRHKQDKYGVSTLKQRLKTGADHNIDNEKKAKSKMNEGKKDACYHKVKSRYSVWPSAYASGALVKCRKVGAKNWGNKTKKEEFSNWRDDFKPTDYEFTDLITPDPLQPTEGIGSKMLDEAGKKCWKGYKKAGTQKLFGKTYNRCVKAGDEVIHDGEQIDEKKGCNHSHEGEECPVHGTSECGPKFKGGDGGKMGPDKNYVKPMGEAVQVPRKTGQIVRVFLTFRGKMYVIQMFFPSVKVPGRNDVQAQIEKVYPGGKVRNYEVSDYEPGQPLLHTEDWQKKSGKNPEGGLNEKGRKSYERQNPGSDLKRPSKKVGNPRRKSFCARMKGMKKKLTSSKTANDPDSRINKSLRAWNC